MGTGKFKIVNGVTVELEDNEIVTYTAEENAASEARKATNIWLTNRQMGYGNVEDQLDEMFHDFDAWKARIQAVKNKYPKP